MATVLLHFSQSRDPPAPGREVLEPSSPGEVPAGADEGCTESQRNRGRVLRTRPQDKVSDSGLGLGSGVPPDTLYKTGKMPVPDFRHPRRWSTYSDASP